MILTSDTNRMILKKLVSKDDASKEVDSSGNPQTHGNKVKPTLS